MARENRKSKKIKKAIAIVGEGISEQEYFISFKRNKRYSFKIKPDLPQNSDFTGIFKKANKLIEKDDYDLVYCLIDMDHIIQDNLEQKFFDELKKLIKQVKKNKIRIIKSNPCFEVWFLLHFLQQLPKFKNDSAVSNKLKNYSPFTNYDKSKDFFKSIDIYKKLEDKVNFAIGNAKKIKPQKTVSYTDVFKIIEELEILTANI